MTGAYPLSSLTATAMAMRTNATPVRRSERMPMNLAAARPISTPTNVSGP